MNKQKLLSLIVLGVFLSGCATTDNWTPTGWTRRQTVAATAAAVCGIAGANASGWINHNNGHPLNEGKAIPAGFFGGALLCGGLAYLLTPEPPPPPPPPRHLRHPATGAETKAGTATTTSSATTPATGAEG